MAHAAASEARGKHRWRSQAEHALALAQMLRRAAQATAYSAMVALFPALIVAAAVASQLPDTLPLRVQMALFFGRVLPSNVSPLLEMYFSTAHGSVHTTRALLGSVVVSVAGASSVMSTLR